MRERAVQIDRVEIKGIGKRYGYHRALASVDSTLRAGRLCAVLGPNGAGKSTLLGILSTLIRPTAGTVTYRAGDVEVHSGEDLRRQIGVLAHDSFVYGELTGIENLRFYGRLYALGDIEARATALLDEVALDERARDRLARTYSRGMLQRLALARALLHDPQVLLLDEPFTGLDRTGSEALSRTLAATREAGKIVLVVTHDLEPIGGLTDHLIILRRGKLVHEDEPDSPHPYRTLKNVYHQFSQ